MSWVQKLYSALGWVSQTARKPAGPAYPITYKHFVSNHPDIVEAFQAEHGRLPPTIGAEFCSGFRLAGSFFIYLGGHPGSEYGDVSIVSRDGKNHRERKYPQYPYLHLSLFPDSGDLWSLSWESVEDQLPRLVEESIRVGREIYNPQTENLRLVNELARSLRASPRVDPGELLMAKAVELDFGGGRWEQGRYVVSHFSGDKLVIDRENGVIRLVAGGDTTELLLEGLRVTRRDREVEGDLKTHSYCYIFMEQGRESISVYERYKDYYEGGPVQAQLDKSQGRSRRRLDRVAQALSSGRLDQLDG